MSQPIHTTDQEPIARILSSTGGYTLRIDFKTQDQTIEYAKRHNIRTRVMG